MSKPFDPPQYPKLWGGAHQLSERKVKGLHLSVPQMPFAASNRVDGAIGYRKGDFDAVVREVKQEQLHYLVAGNPDGSNQPIGVWGSATGKGKFTRYGPVKAYPPASTADDNLIVVAPNTGRFMVISVQGGDIAYEAALYCEFSVHRAARGFKLLRTDTLQFLHYRPQVQGVPVFFSAPTMAVNAGEISWRQLATVATIEPVADPVTRYTAGATTFEIIGDYYPLVVRFVDANTPELIGGLGYTGYRHGTPIVHTLSPDRALMVTPVLRSRTSNDPAAGYVPAASTPVPFITLTNNFGSSWYPADSDTFVTSAIPSAILDEPEPALNWDTSMYQLATTTVVVPLTETTAWICMGGLFPGRIQKHGFINAVTGTITALGTLPSVPGGDGTVKVCTFAAESNGEVMLYMTDRETDTNITLQITRDFVTFQTVTLPWIASRTGQPAADGPNKIIMPVYNGKDYVLMATRDCGRTWKQQAVILANAGAPDVPPTGEFAGLANFFFVESSRMEGGHLATSFAPSWVMDRRAKPPENFPR